MRNSWIPASSIMLLASTPAWSQETVVQNDSADDGSTVAVCPCFAEFEKVAVWLTSPCEGQVVAVQIFWGTCTAGGAVPSLEEEIQVRAAGTFPLPGPVLFNDNGMEASLVGPVLSAGGLNEFRFLDEAATVPLSVPVEAGETFVVTLEFANDNQCPLQLCNLCPDTPSVAADQDDVDGCQPGRNAVFCQGGACSGWNSYCLLGGTGDWIIRAVVDCGPLPEAACCLTDGSCQTLDSIACSKVGGAYQGVDTTCEDPCPGPTGGCCFP
ncbi:MAG: hypothetical protein ACYTGC_14430, partial [Planctomycetota bacterium]